MNFRIFKSPKIWIIISLIIIVFFFIKNLNLLTKNFSLNLKQYLQENGSNLLGTKLSIQSISTKPWGKVSISSIEIGDSNDSFIMIEKLEFILNPLRYRKNEFPPLISKINVISPILVLKKSTDGKINFPIKLKPGTGVEKIYPLINISRGEIKYLDAVNNFSNKVLVLKATVSPRIQHYTKLDIILSFPRENKSQKYYENEKLYITGKYFPTLSHIKLKIHSNSLELNRFRKLIKFEGLNKISGHSTIDSEISYNLKTNLGIENILFNGKLSIRKGSLQYKDIKVDGISSEANFNNEMINFVVDKAFMRGGNFKVKGTLKNFTSPKLEITGFASDVDIKTFLKNSKYSLKGKISSSFALLKYGKDTTINLDLESNNLEIEKILFNHLTASILYKNNIIELKEVKGVSKKGDFKLSGLIETEKSSDLFYIVTAKVNNMPVTERLLDKIKLKNFISPHKATGNLLLANTHKKFIGYGKFYLKNIRIRNLSFDDAVLNFNIDEDTIEISKFIGFGNNYLTYCNGNIKKMKYIDSHLSLVNLPINYIDGLIRNGNNTSLSDEKTNRLSQQLSEGTNKGNINFEGKILGTTDKPVIQGTIEGKKLTLFGSKINFIQSNIVFKNDTLILNSTKFRTLKKSHTMSLTYNLINKKIKSAVRLNSFPIAEIYNNDFFKSVVSIKDGVVEGGAITGSLDMDGHIENPVIRGNIFIKKIYAYGKPIKNIKSEFEYDKVLHSEGIVNFDDDSEIKFIGGYSNKDGFNFSYNSRKFSSKTIMPEKYSKSLTSTLTIDGEINGPLSEPVVSAKILSNNVKINNCGFDTLESHLQYKDNYINIIDFMLSKASETYSIDGRYDLETSSIDASIYLKDTSLSSVVLLYPDNIFKKSYGNIKGKINLWGPITHINGDIFIEGKSINLESYPFDDVTIEASLDDNVLTLSRLNAYNKTAIFEASGSFSSKGATDLNVNVVGIDLKMIEPLQTKLSGLTGIMDANLQVYRDENLEEIIGSATVENLSVKNMAFEKARLLLTAKNEQISLDGTFKKGENHLKVSSYMPVLWEKGYQEHDNKITIKTDEIDVSIFNDILEKFKLNISGKASFDMTFKDIFRNFTISPESKIKLAGINVNSENLTFPISNIYGEILSTAKGEMAIEHIVGSIGGKSFNVRGSTKFNRFSFTDYNLYLSGKSIPIYYKDIIKSNADVDITLKEGENKPLATGSIVFQKGEFTIPQFSKYEKTKIPDYLDWKQNIFVSVPSNFKVKNSTGDLVAYPYGTLYVKGSISNPIIIGSLNCENGYFTLYDSNFSLSEEAEVRFQEISNLQRIDISAFAETESRAFIDNELQTIIISLNISGPIDKLTIKPTSQPPLPGGEDEIYKILAHGERIDELLSGGKNVNDVLSQEATSLFVAFGVRPIRKKIMDKIDIQNFEMRINPNKDIIIEINKKLTRKLSLDWLHIFSKEEENEFELRYKFKPKSYLNWKFDKSGKQTYKVEYLIDF